MLSFDGIAADLGGSTTENPFSYYLWFGTFAVALCFTLVVPFLPRFVGSLGVTENLYVWSGSIYAASFLTSAIMAPVWGNLADRHGRRPMVIRSGLAIALVNLLMSFVTSPWQL